MKRGRKLKAKATSRKPTQHKVEIHMLTMEQTLALMATAMMSGGPALNLHASDDVTNRHIERALDVAAMIYNRTHGGSVHFVSPPSHVPPPSHDEHDEHSKDHAS